MAARGTTAQGFDATTRLALACAIAGVEERDRQAREIGDVTRDQDQFVNDRRRGDD
jgi:hypothetical protein